ncbi:Arylsulfate sulfotransferase-related protein (modular protein) [Candidatus Filomicrobium marinum]|uniref:Arylsulfate sulfotransferase-related protein (Modular protein) n=2 Tax=Filomicrobium TaxID=119044 RepID=A0A0D6JKU9_9HYPH|nr:MULTISPECIES: ribbon-helix-helix domain-containing protein [Filomicrobium]MCV0369020.1 ribbon-helix-helix domain-containing protein [Filomicrobium sp.]CFX63839.1 Arylsulfate sulfotransferase-related protein (modular protein) [Candidatus Filomicrobium marinum]CPR22566.1 Arylsulfate sulfotransferase-related protein (modular protein) [Candidatus Filomicrobium marinum]SDO79823.1 Ribbon-helix-helix domain-containing protein [Filomicrobium insigne]
MRPKKRSFSIKGHRTSLSLEEPFWAALKEIAASDDRSLADMVGSIDAQRGDTGLSSAVRLYVLERYREAARTNKPNEEPAHSTENIERSPH